MPTRPAVPPHVIQAAQRLVGPARVLAGVCRVLTITALVAGIVFWVSLFRDDVRRVSAGTVGAIVALVVVLLPAWWLRHARSTFADATELPARLAAYQEAPRLSINSRADLAALRRGGVIHAVRTIRKTIGEVTDFLSPASTVMELMAPPFWIWTVAAAAVTGLLVLAAVGSLLVLAAS